MNQRIDMKWIKCSILFVMLIMLTYTCRVSKINYQYSDNDMLVINYVPNEETAIKIAEAIWLPIYGEEIYEQKPYIASLLKDSIWIVTGTFTGDIEVEAGGVAYIEIQKKDCKILKVTHGR